MGSRSPRISGRDSGKTSQAMNEPRVVAGTTTGGSCSRPMSHFDGLGEGGRWVESGGRSGNRSGSATHFPSAIIRRTRRRKTLLSVGLDIAMSQDRITKGVFLQLSIIAIMVS